jgi:hypothetical protein
VPPTLLSLFAKLPFRIIWFFTSFDTYQTYFELFPHFFLFLFTAEPARSSTTTTIMKPSVRFLLDWLNRFLASLKGRQLAITFSKGRCLLYYLKKYLKLSS